MIFLRAEAYIGSMKVEIKPRKTYVVKKDESVFKLAERFGVHSSSILAINNIEEIEEGDEIVIPSSSNRFYVVKPVDTLESIARKLNLNKDELIAKNGQTYFIGQKIYY